MKKIISLALVALLLLHVFPVLAEKDYSEKFAWTDSEFQSILEEKEVKGSFCPLEEIGMQIWIPVGILPVELTQTEKNEGYLYRFIAENGNAALSIIRKSLSEEDIASGVALLEDQYDASPALINNVPALVLSYEDDNMNTGATIYRLNVESIVGFLFSINELDEISELMAVSVMPIK